MAELSKKTIVAWRDFFVDPAAKDGLTYLLQNHAPKVNRGDKPEQMMHTGIAFGAYSTALDDVEKILTQLAPVEQPDASISPLQN